MNTETNAPSWAPLAAYLAVCLFWGSTYLAISLAVKTIPPLLMVGMRFVTAGGLLLGWCLIRGERLPPAKTFVQSAITGLLLLFMGNAGVSWAEVNLASGLTAIIVAAVPLWMVIIDKSHWKESFSSSKVILGLLMGFAGVVFLVTEGGTSVNFSLRNTAQLSSFLVLMVGTIAWATGSIYSKGHPVPGSTFIKGSLQMLIAGGALLITSALIGEWNHVSWHEVSTRSWSGLVYLVIFGSLVGYLSYIYVLGVWPSARVGTYAYVNPVVAVFLGWAIASEPLSAGQFTGLAVILAGVMLVNSKQFGKGRITPTLAARKS
jgi:drug/metabolite transporter (DMT)-like permease